MKAVNPERTPCFYEFGPFLVDAEQSLLLRDGQIVPLGSKAFELLLALLDHRGQIRRKDELLRQVWPDTVVEENNLAQAISTLRKALDEHPNTPQYIVTVPGRGYRFIGDVREVEPDGEEGAQGDKGTRRQGDKGTRGQGDIPHVSRSPALPLPRSPTLPLSSSRGLLVALALLVVGVTISGLVLLVVRQSSQGDQSLPQRKLWQLTFDPGLESEPTWSPDGNLIAYSSDRGGNFDIWAQPVGEGDPVQVTKSPAHDWQPDWSPKGNRLVFRSERDGGGLFVVPVLGGTERKISSFGYRPRWSPDGAQILFSSILLTVLEIPKVYVVGLDDKPPREALTGFLPEFRSLRVAWRPDGQGLSVWGFHRQQGWSLWTAPLAGGPPVKSELDPKVKQRLQEADVSFTDFQWAPSGRALYFEGVSQGVKNLWKVEVEPRSLRWIGGPERLTTGASLDTDMALSPDGKRLAFSARAEGARLWSLPFDAATGRVKGDGQPITAAGMDAFFPDLSPDGQRLVFIARRAGKKELWKKSLKDGRETLLAPADDAPYGFPRWSRDGSRVAYLRLRMPNSDRAQIERAVALLPADGGAEQLLTTPGTTGELAWDWSADGKWILGESDRQPSGHQPSGRQLLCLFPTAAAPHAETQMRVIASHPEQNLRQAHFSPGDRWVSFVAARALEAGVSTIYVIPASGGEWKRITEGKYFDDKPRWAPDGRRLYFISNRTGFFNVWGIGFDQTAGTPIGAPFRVTAFESPARMILPNVGALEMGLAANHLILPIMEVSGGIWILENLER